MPPLGNAPQVLSVAKWTMQMSQLSMAPTFSIRKDRNM